MVTYVKHDQKFYEKVYEIFLILISSTEVLNAYKSNFRDLSEIILQFGDKIFQINSKVITT